jgi:hypothetical protein
VLIEFEGAAHRGRVQRDLFFSLLISIIDIYRTTFAPTVNASQSVVATS